MSPTTNVPETSVITIVVSPIAVSFWTVPVAPLEDCVMQVPAEIFLSRA
jgi:hypothetical protein